MWDHASLKLAIPSDMGRGLSLENFEINTVCLRMRFTGIGSNKMFTIKTIWDCGLRDLEYHGKLSDDDVRVGWANGDLGTISPPSQAVLQADCNYINDCNSMGASGQRARKNPEHL